MVKQASATIYHCASQDSQDKYESANAGNHAYPRKQLYNNVMLSEDSQTSKKLSKLAFAPHTIGLPYSGEQLIPAPMIGERTHGTRLEQTHAN